MIVDFEFMQFENNRFEKYTGATPRDFPSLQGKTWGPL